MVQVLTKTEPEVISNSYFRTILILRPSLENHSKQFFNPYNLSYIHQWRRQPKKSGGSEQFFVAGEQ